MFSKNQIKELVDEVIAQKVSSGELQKGHKYLLFFQSDVGNDNTLSGFIYLDEEDIIISGDDLTIDVTRKFYYPDLISIINSSSTGITLVQDTASDVHIYMISESQPSEGDFLIGNTDLVANESFNFTLYNLSSKTLMTIWEV